MNIIGFLQEIIKMGYWESVLKEISFKELINNTKNKIFGKKVK